MSSDANTSNRLSFGHPSFSPAGPCSAGLRFIGPLLPLIWSPLRRAEGFRGALFGRVRRWDGCVVEAGREAKGKNSRAADSAPTWERRLRGRPGLLGEGPERPPGDWRPRHFPGEQGLDVSLDSLESCASLASKFSDSLRDAASLLRGVSFQNTKSLLRKCLSIH